MDTHNAQTIAITACAACGTGLLATDKFCRRCGTNQKRSVSGHQNPPTTRDCSYIECWATSKLEPPTAGPELYHRVSGPLVKALVSGVLDSNTSRLSRAASTGILKSSIVALVLVPIWMIIVLLSPLDAYIAARTLTRTI